MKQRSTIFLAIGLAVFVLVLLGGTAYSLTVKAAASRTAAEDPVPVEGTLIDSRSTQSTFSPAAPSSIGAPAQADLISAERASRIALALVPGGFLVQVPELVNFQGRMAYEVPINANIIYVGAFSGDVLANVSVSNSNVALHAGTQGNTIDQALETGNSDAVGTQPGADQQSNTQQNDDQEGGAHHEGNHDDGGYEQAEHEDGDD